MMRIGQGYDVHAFADQRRLILAGVDISHTQGLAGHSDADVVIHALIDALLGALALGDIGMLFPDNDATYKDIDSRLLLQKTMAMIIAQAYRINNIDITIIAEAPKLTPYKEAMRNNLAMDCHITPNQVSIKATTTEKLGFTGRREGIACMATVLLTPLNLPKSAL